MENRLAGYQLGIEPYKFLPYVEDIKIGRQKSDKSIICECTLHADIESAMSREELIDEFRLFIQQLYLRFPRFYQNFKIVYRNVQLNLSKPRVILLAKYL